MILNFCDLLKHRKIIHPWCMTLNELQLFNLIDSYNGEMEIEPPLRDHWGDLNKAWLRVYF